MDKKPSDSTLPQRGRYRSSLSPLYPHTEKERKRLLRNTLILHFRPPTINAETMRFTLTWGLGGMAATLILLQMFTGVLLKFVYVPTPVDAYASVQTIIQHVPFGRFVRNLHYWSANVLVVIVVLHMLRVMLTGAFHPPRQFNWIIGLVLFALVLMANLSGYLLPYDQLAYWAVTVVTEMIGYLPVLGSGLQRFLGDGSELGAHTLLFFFSLHTAVLPFLLAALMGYHFWRIRKAGGLVLPNTSGKDDAAPRRVPVLPHLIVREVSTALGITAIVMVLALLFDATLAAPANPGLSPNPVRAPWYFAGFQELLMHVHPVLAVAVIPLFAVAFMVCIPYLKYPRSDAGIWFISPKGKTASAIGVLAMFLIATLWIIVDAMGIKNARWASGLPPMLRDGILPMLLFAMLTAGCLLAIEKCFATNRNENVQVLFVMLWTALLVLTIVGNVFRGAFMQLVWPF
jgi:quinol-cytochrome oxidoreductase complex cytochrome b subunit